MKIAFTLLYIIPVIIFFISLYLVNKYRKNKIFLHVISLIIYLLTATSIFLGVFSYTKQNQFSRSEFELYRPKIYRDLFANNLDTCFISTLKTAYSPKHWEEINKDRYEWNIWCNKNKDTLLSMYDNIKTINLDDFDLPTFMVEEESVKEVKYCLIEAINKHNEFVTRYSTLKIDIENFENTVAIWEYINKILVLISFSIYLSKWIVELCYINESKFENNKKKNCDKSKTCRLEYPKRHLSPRKSYSKIPRINKRRKGNSRRKSAL